MGNIRAIAEKELKYYFVSPVGYVFAAAFLGLTSFIFMKIIEEAEVQRVPTAAVYNNIFGIITLLLFVIAPILTMRLLAEEQRMGTIEQLLTCPVRDWEVVFGKFLASFVFYIALLVPTLVYAGILHWVANPDWGPILTGYFGLLLLGAVYLSVGLLASSLTANQIIAAIISIVTLLIMWFAEMLSGVVPSPIDQWVQYFSTSGHINEFISNGVIDTANIVYYVTFAAFCLFLTTRSLEARRWR